MGYYVTLNNSTAVIRKENQDEAYKILCDLNKEDDLKRGGSWSGGKYTEKWFSWMDSNYPEKCKDVVDIIQELGFNGNVDDEGDFYIYGYDNKTGQEQLFFERIAHLVEGEMEWTGEDGYHFKWVFEDGELNELSGKIIYE